MKFWSILLYELPLLRYRFVVNRKCTGRAGTLNGQKYTVADYVLSRPNFNSFRSITSLSEIKKVFKIWNFKTLNTWSTTNNTRSPNFDLALPTTNCLETQAVENQKEKKMPRMISKWPWTFKDRMDPIQIMLANRCLSGRWALGVSNPLFLFIFGLASV